MVGILIAAHAGLLPLWFVMTCSHAVAQERAFQTFDFWRTTLLSPHELIIGQLLGAPLRGMLAVAVTLPITMTAVAFRVSIVDLALLYLVLILFCGMIGLGALVVSMLTTSLRGSRGLLWLGLWYVIFSGLTSFGGFPGIGAMIPYYYLGGIGHWFNSSTTLLERTTVLFGGVQVSSLLVGIVLNLSFGGWFYLMLHRNIKKDLDEVRLLTRWQSVGFALFLNMLFYALWNSSQISAARGSVPTSQAIFLLNMIVLYVIGIIMLTPPERLRVWWRRWSDGRASYLAEDGLPWPWIIVTAGVVIGLAYSASEIADWSPYMLMGQLGIVTLFVMRDVMFLQWCQCHGFKRPFFTGSLYLGLYYFVMQVLFSKAGGHGEAFVPPMYVETELPNLIAPVLVQGAIFGVLLFLVMASLKQPARKVDSSSAKAAAAS